MKNELETKSYKARSMETKTKESGKKRSRRHPITNAFYLDIAATDPCAATASRSGGRRSSAGRSAGLRRCGRGGRSRGCAAALGTAAASRGRGCGPSTGASAAETCRSTTASRGRGDTRGS